MNVTWIFEPHVFRPYADALTTEIESQGHMVRTVPPFYTSLEWGDTSRCYDDFAPEQACVVCHTSYQFAAMVAEDELWVPGTYGLSDTIDCSQYFPLFADCLLNADYKLLSVEDVVSRADSLVRSFGVDGRLFVRPNSGAKAFTGRLFSEAELTPRKLRAEGALPRSLLVVSRPQSIVREWRFIVADHRVIAASLYKEADRFRSSGDVPAAAIEFAEAVASRDFQPDRVWVLDTCETSTGEMKVVEINAFSSSLWYSCDLRHIVAGISEVALDDWKQQTSPTLV